MDCPYIGTKKEKPDCRRPLRSIKGIKQHLSRTHGGWKESEIADKINEMARAEKAGRKEQSSFSAPAEPVSIAEQSIITDSSGGAKTSPAPTRKPRDSAASKQASVRMSGVLGEFKEILAEEIPEGIVQFFRNKLGYEGQLSERSKGLLKRFWSAYFDLVGVDVQATTTQFRVSGKFLMIFFPVAMIPATFALMHGKKREVPPAASEPEPEEENQQEPPVETRNVSSMFPEIDATPYVDRDFPNGT